MPTTLRARTRAQLTAHDVGVSLGGRRILDRVSVTLTPGDRLAIVGENGRGKTTLLHMLAGTLAPDTGEVTRVGSLGLAEQELPAGDTRTVGELVDEAIAEARTALAELDAAAASLADGTAASAERYSSALEAAEALDAWDADRRVTVALEELGAETDRARALAELSVGQRYRVRLACLLGASDDFLLLDEPTNHLDRAGLEFLTDALRTRASAVAFVSHDRALLRDAATRIMDLDPSVDGLPRLYGNGYAGYREGRRAERQRWVQAFERQEAERDRLEADLESAQARLESGWRPPKGTGKHQRATRAPGLVQALHRRQEALEAGAVDVPEPPLELAVPPMPARPGVTMLAAEEVTVQGRLPHPVDLVVRSGDRIVITGPNGAGKSTLLTTLAGGLETTTGVVRRARRTRIGTLRQESELPVSRRAAEVYRDHIGRLIASGELADQDAVPLESLGLLRETDAAKRVGELSMGQQRRLDLALALAGRPHVLLLDEPTNHLSIALVDELTEALQATDAAVVVSTHDRQLLRDLAEWRAVRLGRG